MPAKPWFPTFIYTAPVQAKGSDLLRTMTDACRAVREGDREGQLWCRDHYPAGYTSYGTMRNLHRTARPFIDLERRIWPHVRRFARRIDMDLREANLAMTDCWVNVMSRDAAHPLHLHPGAVVSGTFYVRTPENCSDLRFEDPRIEKFLGMPPRHPDARPENRQHVAYPAVAGRLILFESWLRHEVTCNPTEEERISVSFNYTWV